MKYRCAASPPLRVFPCFLLLWTARLLAAESPCLYGIHDADPSPAEYLARITNATGAGAWVTATVAVGANPNDLSGADFSALANAGHTVICRINYGYYPDGTIPVPSKYDDFATRCGNFVAASAGCNIWLIGNELNLSAEWPFDGARFNYVSPQDYAGLFRKVCNAIKSVHPNDKVLPQATAPWGGPYGPDTKYVNGSAYPADGQPLTWVQYENQVLSAITNTGLLDGIALHIGSRGYFYSDIHSTNTFGGLGLYSSFYVYKDWVDYGIPPALYGLPLYVTECNGYYYWKGGHPENTSAHYEAGWMQEVYAEINRYNQLAATSGKPIFRCLNLYRWCAYCDDWNIDADASHPNPYEQQILLDLDAAAAQRYTWPTNIATTNPPPAPTGLSATVGNALVSLSWNAAAFAAGYNVKRSTIDNGPYSVIASNVSSTGYLDTLFTPNTTYYYRVSALNAFGESTNSLPVSARPTNGLPDVVVTSISWTPAGPLIPGTNLVFKATIRNQGSAPTPTSASVPLGVGFSVSGGGNYTWASYAGPLASGSSLTLTASGGSLGNNFWTATPGPHTVTANVDDVDRFLESREDNNLFSSNFNVFNQSYAVNSGGDAVASFAADAYVSGGYTYSVTNAIDTSGVPSPAPQAVYQSERWSNFSYSFPNLVPGAFHTVRLHFAEIFYDSPGLRRFNASVNTLQVLTNLDVFAEAGGKYRALAKTFNAMADASGAINVSFSQGTADWPKCSGIEVLLTAFQTNTPPVLAPIANQVVNAGAILSLTALASDTNIPAQTLAFSLVSPPPGASINPTSGLFAWTAPQATSLLTNSVTIRVTDDGSPPLSDTKTFSAIVVPPPKFSSISQSNGSVTLNWLSYPGKTYRVQYKDNLTFLNWTNLAPDVLATSASAFKTDTPGVLRRFYRVQLMN